jgi:hypothetical protein
MEDRVKVPRLVLAEDDPPMAVQLRSLLAGSSEIVATVEDGPALVAAADALESGGRAYVLKCDACDELVPAVRAVVAGEEYVSTNARAALGWGGVRRASDDGPDS